MSGSRTKVEELGRVPAMRVMAGAFRRRPSHAALRRARRVWAAAMVAAGDLGAVGREEAQRGSGQLDAAKRGVVDGEGSPWLAIWSQA